MALAGYSSGTAVTDSNGNYSFSGLRAGRDYEMYPTTQPELTFTPAILSFNNLNADQNATFVVKLPAGKVLITEFRFRGPNGAGDEFVELGNNTNSPITVNTTDGSEGWALVGADGVIRAVIPNGTVIPARGHYLLANSSAYSLATQVAPDLGFVADIPDDGGIALFRTTNVANFTLANRLDAVSFSNASGTLASLSSEGAALAPVGINIASGEQGSFVRKANVVNMSQDTNSNASDFVFISMTGGAFGGTVPSVLGAPGPENIASPVQSNDTVLASLIDPTTSRSASPNFVRVGSGNSGTLSIRRHFTNNTGTTISRLRFRVTDITTLNSPVAAPPQADFRLTDSVDQTVFTGLGVVNVRGTTLEMPGQFSGGGLNSTVTVPLPKEGLAHGSSIDVQFLLNVVQNGRYRFFVSVEALP